MKRGGKKGNKSYYLRIFLTLGKNTNVIELYNLLQKGDYSMQKTWYNSGIGTYARPSWRSWKYLKRVIDNKIDLAIAWLVIYPLILCSKY